MSTRVVLVPGADLLMIKAGLDAIESKYAPAIVQDAANAAPVDTGRLRDSIHQERTEDSVQIVAATEYAAAVEMGTSHTRAQPYLKPAAYQVRG